MTSSIILICAMLLLSAFFSGGEMAFLASNKLVMEINRRRFPRMSKITDIFMANSGVLISTILVGNNVAMVIYGLAFSDVFGPFFTSRFTDSASVLLFFQTLVSTIIIIVTAEFLPKTLIQINPSVMLNVLALPLMFFYIIFYPIGRGMQMAAHFFITKVFRSKAATNVDPLMPGRIDLDNLLSKQAENENTSDGRHVADGSQEAKLMKNALDFSKIKVRDCFVPRTEIAAIDINDSVEELDKMFIDSGYSKILVYEDSIDNIIGYVHVSAMFKGIKNIKEMMTPIVVVPETMGAQMLLKLFTGQHKSIALVVDEFGGTAGMITIEDVLEEIFGEIDDEHDTVEYVEKEIGENEYVFSARLEIDYLNEKYDLGLPVADEYETLAGLILSETQSIPERGEVVNIDGFEFRILVMSGAKVEKVKVKKL
ncbi:MAG: hemolysin family protein [Bacteroidales bacterium]|nr:hemolysin family protein [Bacteroidales bacterium]